MNTVAHQEFCQAAIFTGPQEPLRLQQVSIPKLRAGEVLVRVSCCTICGSDLHTFTGKRGGPAPSVLGHEIMGFVEAIADSSVSDIGGTPVRTGDLITWSVAASCGCCRRCGEGLPQKCDSLFKYGHEVFSDHDGLSGGLAEFCVLRPGTAVVRLPLDAPAEVFCPASCATATVAAAVGRAGTLTGKRVLVFGAGMLGLTTCAFARSLHADHISVCDVNDSRLRRAADFGADRLLTAPPTDAFDCIFEMSGHSGAVEAGINAATIGGTVILVGSVSPSPAVSVDPERIVRRLLSIYGVHNYVPQDLLAAVAFLQEDGRQFPFATLVEKSFSLASVNDAFELALRDRPIRVAIHP